MKIHYKQKVAHTVQSKSPKPYVVHARQGSIGYDFFVMADDADLAIDSVKSNALAVIAAVRTQCIPSELIARPIVIEPSPQDWKEATKIEEDIRQWDWELSENEDRTDELFQARRETLMELIVKGREKIESLRTAKPTGKSQSKFEERVSRMIELLNMEFSATPVDMNRAIPVSYWDDSRSVLNYCP